MPVWGLFFVLFLLWYFRDAPPKDQLQSDTREWLDIPVFIIAGRLIILRSQLIAMGIYTLLFAAIVWPRWLEPAIRTQFQRPAVTNPDILATRTAPPDPPPAVEPSHRIEIIDRRQSTPISKAIEPPKSTRTTLPNTPPAVEPRYRVERIDRRLPGIPTPVTNAPKRKGEIIHTSADWIAAFPNAKARINPNRSKSPDIIQLPATKELPVIETPATDQEPKVYRRPERPSKPRPSKLPGEKKQRRPRKSENIDD